MIDVKVLAGSMVRDHSGRTGRVKLVSLPWVRIAWDQPGSPVPVDEVFRRGDPEVWEGLELHTLPGGWRRMGDVLGSRPRGRLRQELEGILRDLDAAALGEEDGPEDPPIRTEVWWEDAEGKEHLGEFADRRAASLFVDSLLGEGRPIWWRAEGMDDAWLVDVSGAFECMAEGCLACEAGRIEALLAEAERLRPAERQEEEGGSKRHSPYKRRGSIGPSDAEAHGEYGGGHRSASATGDWDCTSAGPYKQKCTHTGTGYTMTVRIKRGYKKDYNFAYKRAQSRGRG